MLFKQISSASRLQNRPNLANLPDTVSYCRSNAMLSHSLAFLNFTFFLVLAIITNSCGSGDEEVRQFLVKKNPGLANLQKNANVPRTKNQANSPTTHSINTSATTTKTKSEAPPNKLDQINFTVPQNWKKINDPRKNVISYSVSETGICSIYALEGDRGIIIDNLNLFRRQIGLAPINENETLRNLNMRSGNEFNYFFTRIFNPEKPARALLAAFVPIDNHNIIVKLSETPAKINSHESAFSQLCYSIKIKNKDA